MPVAFGPTVPAARPRQETASARRDRLMGTYATWLAAFTAGVAVLIVAAAAVAFAIA
jgi:hypothetical protein